SRLVDDLLHLARADAGKVKLRMQEFYLNDLLTECCRSAQTLANARNLSLECSPAADASFRGDEELLRRLLMNLLDNAIRYTPPGGTVSAALETNGAGVRLRVSDTGVGIPAEDAGRVFERFYRASSSRSRGEGGFGLLHDLCGHFVREVMLAAVVAYLRRHLLQDDGSVATLQRHCHLPGARLTVFTYDAIHCFLRFLNPGSHSSGAGS